MSTPQEEQQDALNLKNMTRTERCDYIASEKRATNEPQITMAPHEIDALLSDFDKVKKHQLPQQHSAAASLAIINDNWGVDMANFPSLHHGRNFRPSGDASTWDLRLLGTMAILSDFTPGQGTNMGSLLCYAVELRIGGQKNNKDFVERNIDVKRVIKDLLLPLREPTPKLELMRKRKTECVDRRKSSKKTRDEDDAEEALDEIVMNDMGRKMDTTGIESEMSDEAEDDM